MRAECAEWKRPACELHKRHQPSRRDTSARVAEDEIDIVDLDECVVRIRTLKRRAEHWRAVPVPPELMRDFEMVHYLREASPRRVKEPLWTL